MPIISRRRFLRSTTGLALSPFLTGCTKYAVEVPRSNFDATSTAEDVTAGLDLTGTTALVTGCNSGIGFETMRVLALRGAHVLGTARSEQKGREACDKVEGQCTPFVLELTDFDSVKACAGEIKALGQPLDVLVCNAGVFFRQHRQVGDLEMHFVVNHLGHFLLVNLLLDQLISAPQGRVVVVGSDAHRRGKVRGIRFDDLTGKSWEESAYRHSKLANGLFSLELARRLSGTSVTSNSLHPGSVATNIFRNTNNPESEYREKTIEEGAATSCYLATNPALREVSGYYFIDCNPAEPSELMQDAAMAQKLWEVSEDLVREYLA